MIQLTIDDKQVAATEGQTVLEAAREAGIRIPTLCEHESLPPYGACRFCIVEVTRRGKTKLEASCTLPAAEGMTVQTKSERVLKTRRILVELMLARCPESPVIRDLAAEIGVGECRLDRVQGEKSPCPTCGMCSIVDQMRLSPPDGMPSTFVGKGGCILCGMCVRLCDEVLGIGALGFEGRGAKRLVTTPFGQPSDVCLTCGACSSVCPTGAIEHRRIRPSEPVLIPAEFDEALAERKPVYKSFPQAVPNTPAIDPDTCLYYKTGGCKICEDNCQAQAIDHEQEDETIEVDVGTIILATGFKTFDAARIPYYGYGVYPNVYTSLEVERLVNASGPTGGEVVLRDGQQPKSVGIIHCVGSRDDRTNKWCSRVCCMYSLKLAHLIKEHTGAEVYNFYIDMRANGKGYEEFYEKLLTEGMHCIRGRVAEVSDWTTSPEEEGKLVLRVEDTLAGFVRRIPVDMVVLSVGLEPQADAQDVRRLFNISCSTDGFFLERHPKLAPVNTATDGIFLAGCCQSPKDIPDTVAQAGAAAAEALSLIDAGHVAMEPMTSFTIEDDCSGCKICLPLCPYTAIERDEEKAIAMINEALCKGCGVCVAACPSGSIRQNLYEDDEIFTEIEEVLAHV